MATKTRRPAPPRLEIPAELLDTFNARAKRSSALPPHCRWNLGDTVQRHGYSGHRGHPDDLEALGFTGWIAGYFGATCLVGITTTGREWCEEWGALHPIGQPVDPWGHCVCCTEQRQRWHTEHVQAAARRPFQPSLFDLAVSL